MAFNQQRVKAQFTGAATAYSAPLAAFNGSTIALNTVTSGSTASSAGLVIALAGTQYNIEWESLVALVETKITTNTITVSSKWQGSWDGTNWVDLILPSGSRFTQVAAAGTGSLVTTQYFHPLTGINPGVDYVRAAVQVGVTTGAAGDNVVVSYGYRKRSFLA